jgi:hypothetical protein
LKKKVLLQVTFNCEDCISTWFINEAEIGKEKELTMRFRNTFQSKITDENGCEMETEISVIITQE